MKKYPVLFARYAALLLFLMCGGCEIINEAMEMDAEYSSTNPNSEDFRARFVLGVFSIVRYPRATMVEREIDTGDGSTIWINTNQLIDSKRIREVKVIPRPGNPDACDLQVRFDDRGKNMWHMAVAASRGRPLALLVDGRYISSFVPEMPTDDASMRWVFIRGGLDSYTARGVVRFAKRNYAYFNPSASDWFKW